MLPSKQHFFRIEILETIFGITILCRTHLFLEKKCYVHACTGSSCISCIACMQKQTFTRIKIHMEQWISPKTKVWTTIGTLIFFDIVSLPAFPDGEG